MRDGFSGAGSSRSPRSMVSRVAWHGRVGEDGEPRCARCTRKGSSCQMQKASRVRGPPASRGPDGAVRRRVQGPKRLCVGEPATADDEVRPIPPFHPAVQRCTPANGRHCRRHRGGPCPSGRDGLRRDRRCAPHRRSVRPALACAGVRRVWHRAETRRRARGDGVVARGDRSGPTGGDGEHRVRDPRGGPRHPRRRRVPRRSPDPPGLGRRLLLAGRARRLPRRGGCRPHPGPARQAGRPLQRREQCDPRDGRHRGPTRPRERVNGSWSGRSRSPRSS